MLAHMEWMHFVIGGCLGMFIATAALTISFFLDAIESDKRMEKKMKELEEILFTDKDPLIYEEEIELPEVIK